MTTAEPWRDAYGPIADLLKSREGLGEALARVEALLRQQPTMRDRIGVWRELHRQLLWSMSDAQSESLSRAMVNGLPREAALQECLDLVAAGGRETALAYQFLPAFVADEDVERVLGMALDALRAPREDVGNGGVVVLCALAERDPSRLSPVVERLLRSPSMRAFHAGLSLLATPAGRGHLPLALERARIHVAQGSATTRSRLMASAPHFVSLPPLPEDVPRLAAFLRSVRDDASLPSETRRDAANRAESTADWWRRRGVPLEVCWPLVEAFAFDGPPDLRAAWRSAHSGWARFLLREGRPAEARQAASEALAIAEEAAARSPAEPGTRRDLMTELTLVSDVELALGDAEAALRRYRGALALAQGLHDDSEDDAWRPWEVVSLALAHEKVGDALRTLGRPAEAARSLAEARRLVDARLADRAPNAPPGELDAMAARLASKEAP